ncbi:NADPH-adrenodoxin reductase [Sporobolomyces koalae]|uniref:NADPH-adrenodoxin reductase n=1 Tax=Sporobolomyces koalae TaxID=500713 RepID=UPI003180738E
MLVRIPRPPRAFAACLNRSTRSSTWFRCASSTSTVNLESRPFRIGIVGGGPAGFYAATRLLSLPGTDQCRVDLFELLPSPFGLARFGVAPDHPEVKNCEHKFEETAQDPRFRYFGNVQICGTSPEIATSSSSATTVPNLSASPLAVQIPLESLREHYDAVVLTYGASLDRPLGIPGEYHLSNVLSARSFVNWYNGHPYHSSLLAPLLDLSKIEHVSIIGQGNVALDVARILLKPIDELKPFDVPEYAIEELSRSRVKRVEIVGRRGITQLAATTKELREMINLEGVAFDPLSRTTLEQATRDVERMGSQGRPKKRALGLLQQGSKTRATTGSNGKSWSLEFLRSPTELLPAPSSSPSSSKRTDTLSPLASIAAAERVGAVRYDLNELVDPSASSTSGDFFDPSRLIARPTGKSIEVQTDMVFKSVGYRSIGLPGLPFDERKGVVRNIEGRVTNKHDELLEGLYTSGWLAKGPNGVIATTMFNAFSTADLVASDLTSSTKVAKATSDRSVDDMIERFRGDKRWVSWQDWQRIDKVEKDRGHANGKLREKITSVEEMLKVL